MITLIDKIKSEMIVAMKNKEEVRRDILKLVMSEANTQSVRQTGELTDDQILKIIAKIIENNTQSLGFLDKADVRYLRLTQENEVLSSFVPKTISAEETFALLVDLPGIKGAKSDGQATGEAIKFLKSSKICFDNKLVSEIVKKLRESI